MNRFLIDHHPDAIAKSLCDQHIVKMPLEEAQMLCTALWHHAPQYAEWRRLYKPVHKKHPCTLWAMETRANFSFAFRLYDAMLREFTHRFKDDDGNDKIHGAAKHYNSIRAGIRFIPNKTGDGAVGLTPHPQCFSGHDELMTDERWPIQAYRAFYKVDKSKFARYNKGRSMPIWMQDIEGATELSNVHNFRKENGNG